MEKLEKKLEQELWTEFTGRILLAQGYHLNDAGLDSDCRNICTLSYKNASPRRFEVELIRQIDPNKIYGARTFNDINKAFTESVWISDTSRVDSYLEFQFDRNGDQVEVVNMSDNWQFTQFDSYEGHPLQKGLHITNPYCALKYLAGLVKEMPKEVKESG